MSDLPVRDPSVFHGRVETPVFESDVLRGNRSGDPHVRELPVYLPPGWDSGERLPVVFLLASFTSRAQDFLETHPWRGGVIREFDQACARGAAPRAILVMPDCWTRFGGSQYVASSYLGDYESYLVHEIVPEIDARYPTLAGRRAVAGKSSGGFGALRLAMRHPDVFPVAASLSGDVGFENCFGAELLACLRGLVPYGGDPRAFLDEFLAAPSLDGDKHAVINVLAMAACYSPNPDSPLGFDLPMDLVTGARLAAVWQRWLDFDPLVACSEHAANLRSLELLHLECGLRDEFHLQWGLRQLTARLRELGVPFDHEEHDGSHRGLSHRFRALLPKLVRALTRAP